MSSGLSRNSGTDPVAASLREASVAVARAVLDLSTSNPVILLDGRSGAGKSSLAHDIVARWPLRGRVQLVALDALYPGWDGLRAGVDVARDQILVPHGRGLIGTWQRWDWAASSYAEAHAVDPSLPLIVEGSGILTPETARLADLRIWLESPATSRRRRALDRDGDTYRPHWDRWAEQEDAHIARDAPHRHATQIFVIP